MDIYNIILSDLNKSNEQNILVCPKPISLGHGINYDLTYYKSINQNNLKDVEFEKYIKSLDDLNEIIYAFNNYDSIETELVDTQLFDIMCHINKYEKTNIKQFTIFDNDIWQDWSFENSGFYGLYWIPVITNKIEIDNMTIMMDEMRHYQSLQLAIEKICKINNSMKVLQIILSHQYKNNSKIVYIQNNQHQNNNFFV